MTLSSRDSLILRQIGALRQMSTSQIRAVVFHQLSQTPLDRALSRLVRGRYLSRIGRRASSAKGGVGSTVYQLGPKGWAILQKPGRYWPFRAVNEHTLRAVDVYVALLAAERENRIKILSFELERIVGDARADIWLQLGLIAQRLKVTAPPTHFRISSLWCRTNGGRLRSPGSSRGCRTKAGAVPRLPARGAGP